MKVNEFFEKEYLIVGNTYDNFIFENCPNDFLQYAKSRLVQSGGEVKSCLVCLDRRQEEFVEEIFKNCDELQKKILARDLIVALIMKEILNDDPQSESYKFVCQQIKAFMLNDFDTVKNMHVKSFMPYDIKRVAKSIGKIELSFVLDGTLNKYLQSAINIFISSREPYSVKIFTNKERLSTYYDVNGNLIECPHDFMRRDVNKFIEENIVEKEQ